MYTYSLGWVFIAEMSWQTPIRDARLRSGRECPNDGAILLPRNSIVVATEAEIANAG